MRKKTIERRVKLSRFPISVFVLTFVAMVILTTIQQFILWDYIDYASIPVKYIIMLVIFWALVSTAFTFFSRVQIHRAYDKPLLHFANATRKVACGDFSVYVRPIHTSDKVDYLDVMIEDFNKMVQELGSIETLKTEFFSNVSHEIRTPLSAIQNYAELLQCDILSDPNRKEYASAIIQSTKKLSGLITNILKLNKLDQQTITPVPECYDLCAQLSACALQIEELWEGKGIEFLAELEDRAIIEADESLMELVWNNLLSNAVKFTDRGGTVTLTQTSTDSEVIVTVSDTGCGMREETLRHIFDKFYQGDTSHATEGNGLGLALVLRVLQLLDGSITARSVPGEGSQFTVVLPVSREKEQEYA